MKILQSSSSGWHRIDGRLMTVVGNEMIEQVSGHGAFTTHSTIRGEAGDTAERIRSLKSSTVGRLHEDRLASQQIEELFGESDFVDCIAHWYNRAPDRTPGDAGANCIIKKGHKSHQYD